MKVCPECNKSIVNKDEYIFYCVHKVGINYEVVYIPSQGGYYGGCTLVYDDASNGMVPTFQINGIGRRITKEVIERLLLLK